MIVANPRLGDDFRQAVVRDLLFRSFKQVTVPLFLYQVIAVAVIPAADPRSDAVAQGGLTRCGDQPPLGAFLRVELFVASILTAY